ncbi:MAG: hypothetical protein ACRD7E_16675, partial [Bryobacteraceae bacterium]
GVVRHVSAASFNGGPLAAESIVTALTGGLGKDTAQAQSTPLPTTLAGTSISVKDASSITRKAPLFHVSPGQVNYQLPAGTSLGTATITITAENGRSSTRQAEITAVAPGVFALNAAGLAAANVIRVSGGGQTVEDIFQLDESGLVVPRPIDLGSPEEQIYLILYGTGLRAAGTSDTTVTIGGENATVLFAGAQPDFPGLDQVNVLVPRSLLGQGTVPLVLTAAGQVANTVYITVK